MSATDVKFRDMEVLVCDDDDAILNIMSHILGEMGFGFVKTTTDPETALRLIREPVEKPFDLVICDWSMPGMSGMEILQKLRDGGNPVPFIMLTAKVSQDAVVEARDTGVDAYIAKPFTAELVQRKVAAIAGRGAPGQS
jgi:two-component system chemotaxis response regulator CheY